VPVRAGRRRVYGEPVIRDDNGDPGWGPGEDGLFGGEFWGQPAGRAGGGERNPIETPQPLEDNGAPLPNGWKRQCGAKTRDGSPCRRQPLAGCTRCRPHGGLSPAGVASPHFKNGRRSKYFPKDFRAKFNDAYQDQEYASLRSDLAMLEVKVRALLGQLDKDPPVPWTALKEAVVYLRKAETDEQMEESVSLLERLTDQGNAAAVSQEKTWRQLRELAQERVKAAAAENKRMHDASMVVTIEQMSLLFRSYLAVLCEEIQDRALLRRVHQKVINLLPPDLRGRDPRGDSDG
jgi:hypothetical protein